MEIESEIPEKIIITKEYIVSLIKKKFKAQDPINVFLTLNNWHWYGKTSQEFELDMSEFMLHFLHKDDATFVEDFLSLNEKNRKLDFACVGKRRKAITEGADVVFNRDGRIIKFRYITGKNLIILPKSIVNLTHLRILSLSVGSHNPQEKRRVKFPREIGQITSLRSLTLSLHLDTFPIEICSMITLRNLNLSGNKLITVPLCIKNLTHLRKLNLARNAFKRFPESVCNLENLKWFWINYNEINSLPDSITKLQYLQNFYWREKKSNR